MSSSRRCSRCGTRYEGDALMAVMFRPAPLSRRVVTERTRRTVCVACEQDGQDRDKHRDPWLAKSRTSTSRHMHDHNRRAPQHGWPTFTSWQAFALYYGWPVDVIARAMERAYADSCVYCHVRYAEMSNGDRSNLTIDIIDPDSEPYYSTNVNLCCMTCNKIKQKLAPKQWELYLYGMRLWLQQRERGWNPLTGDESSLFYQDPDAA